MSMPPCELVRTVEAWQACLQQLEAEPRVALDLEANSMFAYREQACLIQITIPAQDFIIDPLAPLDLSGLGRLLANPSVEKVFHAAEYDIILLKRGYGWQVNNLFDTMWAARILGYKKYGLANLLNQFYQVKLNKRYQKSNWCKRPLSSEQITYAQYDTHYLLKLRDDLETELEDKGCDEEAEETFTQQTRVEPPDTEFNPDSFWSMSGVYDLKPRQRAVLKALNIYRDQEAQRRNQPLFKIFGERTLLELAEQMPQHLDQLYQVYGMTNGQVHRYGHQLLRVVETAQKDRPPSPPRRGRRQPDQVLNRYEKLHSWRKTRAQKRGVESDVIISRDALWAIAKTNPKTASDLAQIEVIGDWRCHAYGKEILGILHKRR